MEANGVPLTVQLYPVAPAVVLVKLTVPPSGTVDREELNPPTIGLVQTVWQPGELRRLTRGPVNAVFILAFCPAVNAV